MNLRIEDIVWPEFTGATATVLVAIIVVTMIAVVALAVYTQFMNKQERAWNELLRFAYQHRLTSNEVKILHNFFLKNQQTFSFQQNLSLLKDQEVFKEKFRDYLADNKIADSEKNVQILDKLFLPSSTTKEILSLNDVIIGESCSVHFTDSIQLGVIVKRTDQELLVRIPEWDAKGTVENEAVILYFYRPEMGGFLLAGNIRKFKKGSIVFKFDGTIEMKGDGHLMAKIQRNGTLKPNEIDIIPDMTIGQINSIDENGNPNDLGIPQKVELSVQTELVSDQAILLRIKEYIIPGFLKKHDIWELTIPVGEVELELHGRILKSKEGEQKYIFKFIHVTDEDRKILFEEIKKHNPVHAKID
jgi:hypothetical protein